MLAKIKKFFLHNKSAQIYLLNVGLVVFILALAFYPLISHAGITDEIISGAFNSGISIIQFILNAFIKLFGSLLTVVMGVLTWIAQYNKFIDNPYVNEGWVILRDLVNMFFVLGLLFIAFVTVLGIEKQPWNKLLARLLIMAIMVNFSKTICGLIIDFFQVLMLTFVNAFKDITSGNIEKALGMENWFKIQTSASVTSGASTSETNWGEGLKAVAGSLLGLIYVMVAFIVVVIFCVVLAFRMIALWILVVFSPLAFFAWAFEGAAGKVGKFANEWWDQFFNYCVVGPCIAFFLWISLITMAKLNYDQMNTSVTAADRAKINADIGAGSSMDQVLSVLIGIIMLVSGLTMCSKYAGAAAGVMTKGANFIKDQTAGRLERAAVSTGRYAGALPGRAVKGAVGLGLAGAGKVGGFAYKQYVQPRLKGTGEDISKAWQTKTSLRDFGQKVVSGYGERFSTSESPTLRSLGKALGGKVPVGQERPLPKGIVARIKNAPISGDFLAMMKGIFNETSFSKENNEYIRNRTQKAAAANISKDYKPLRDVDAKRSEDIMKMMPIDTDNIDMVKQSTESLLADNKGKKLDLNAQRVAEGLITKSSSLGILNNDTYDKFKDMGFMEGSSDLERRQFENKMEDNEKKSLGFSHSYSGNVFNPITKRQEDYTDVKDNLDAATGDLAAQLGWDKGRVRDTLKTIDFEKLRSKDADDNTILDMGALKKLIASGKLSSDQAGVLSKVDAMGADTNKASLLNTGLARSTEFQNKRKEEIGTGIKAGGKEEFTKLHNERNFGNIFHHGLDNVEAVTLAAAEQRQYSANVSKPIRERDNVIDDFLAVGDNNARVEMLRKNSDHLDAIIESLEHKIGKNKKISDMDDAALKTALDSDSTLGAWDIRNRQISEKDAAAQMAKSKAFDAKYDADNRLVDEGAPSETSIKQREETTAREGVGVKLRKAIADNVPGLSANNVEPIFNGINEQIDAIVNSAKDQQTRTAALAKLVSNQLAKAGVSLGLPQINQVATALEGNTEAIKKRIKTMDDGYKEAGTKIKFFMDTLNSYTASGRPPSQDDLATLNILQQTIVDGINKYAKNNALDPNRFKVDEVKAHLEQMLGTETDSDKQVNINSFISKMNELFEQKTAAKNPKVIKDLNTQINKLQDSWKGLYSDLAYFGYKT